MQLPYANLAITHQNPGASMPLILPVTVICNTSDEALFDNIRANSAKPVKWVKQEEAQEGVAVLCGSGPSLAESLVDIQAMVKQGATVFALNGAAKWLFEHGVYPDYHVIIDAREETAALVGPAKHYLYGSQVHPKTFDQIEPEHMTLWHLQIEGMDEYLPEGPWPEHALIGGAASVGNCATCLAYALGYRELHCYGYDSSHRDGHGHAFPQPLNDGDPCCMVRFHGKEYRASLTMKLQAERFLETSAALKSLGCSVLVHGDGLLPAMYNEPKLSEQEKYELAWAQPEYRNLAPGELVADKFFELIQPPTGAQVIDFGCGTGRGAMALLNKDPTLEVTLLDFAANCRDPGAEWLPFVLRDLAAPAGLLVRTDYGYCCDVMEHIPQEGVDLVLVNIMDTIRNSCFFQISLVPDGLGYLVGQPLHLSVHPFDWWLSRFRCLGHRVAKSLNRGDTAIFVVEP